MGMHQRNLRYYDYDGHFIPLAPWLAHLFWELLGLSLPPLAVWGYNEKAVVYKAERQPSLRTESVSTLILDLPGLWDLNTCCLSHPIYGYFFIAQTKRMIMLTYFLKLKRIAYSDYRVPNNFLLGHELVSSPCFYWVTYLCEKEKSFPYCKLPSFPFSVLEFGTVYYMSDWQL